jgi:hypothetical protein
LKIAYNLLKLRLAPPTIENNIINVERMCKVYNPFGLNQRRFGVGLEIDVKYCAIIEILGD